MRPIMQLKLGIQEATPLLLHPNYQFDTAPLHLCNKCGSTHDMAIYVILTDGPVEKQSIAYIYDGKTLPKMVADLTMLASVALRLGGNPFRKISTKYF